MAEENIIIFKTQIEGLESIDQLNKQLAEAKKQYKESQAGSEKYIEAVNKISETNSKLDAHKQFLKQVDNQSKANTNTIEGLRNKYKDLALATTKLYIGSAEFKKTQSEAKAVSDQLKELEKGMGNTSRNVGNYAEGFKEALGGLGGGFGKAINGIQGFNTALASNPIGAVVQVMNLLFDALSKNDNLMVAFQGTMKGIGVIIDNVSSFIAGLITKFVDFTNSGSKASNVFNEFGKRLINAVLAPFQLIKDFIPVISNLMDGNFTQAFKAGGTAMANFGKNITGANNSTNALIKSIGGLVGSGSDLEKGLDALEEKQNALNVTLSENDMIVQRLRIQAKRRGEDTTAGLKLLEQADAIETKSQKLRTGLLDEEIKLYDNYRKTLGEGSSEEEQIRFKLNDLRVKRNEAEKQSFAILEKNANAEASLREKQRAANEKAAAEQLKQLEAQQKAAEKAYDDRTKLAVLEIENEIKRAETLEEIRILEIEKAQTIRDAEVESIYNTDAEKAVAEQEFKNTLLDINDKYNKDKAKQDEAATKKAKEEADKEKAIQEAKYQNNLNALANFQKASALLGEEGKNVAKALNIALATVDTYRSAVLAYQSAFLPIPDPTSPVRGAIYSAAAVGAGLASIASIAAAAGGGDFVTTKPTLLLVGDNPGGRERVTVEPLSGRGQTKIGNSGLIAMAGGGSLTVNTSGMSAISSTASNDVFNQMALSKNLTDTFAKLGNPVVSVVDIKKVSNKTTVTENKARLKA
jgi:hypothetical protein